MPLASIPSPARASWRLGPLPIHAYALCVIAGIIVAIAVASRRYRKDGRKGIILDVAAWAVPFGLASAVVHAVLLDGKHDFTAIGGLWHAATVGVALLGVPGAIALGAAGAWIACRRAGVQLGPVAGAAAPAAAFGLALASLGNWWAQQFYGQPSGWWWAVQISPTRRAPGYENYATFQPLFLYQALWDVAVGFGVIWAARRFSAVRRAHLPADRGRRRGRQLLGPGGADRTPHPPARDPVRGAGVRRRVRPGCRGPVPDQAQVQARAAPAPQVRPGTFRRGFSG